MLRHKVDIQVLAPFRGKLPHPWLRRAVVCSLEAVGVREPCQVGLVVADDDTVHRLNRDYRGMDEVTDVLAFSFDHPGHFEGEKAPQWVSDQAVPFITPSEAGKSLGEVILSYPQAVRQAEQHGWEVEREVALLIVHGVLHLLGHDHFDPDDEKAMRAREQEALARLS